MDISNLSLPELYDLQKKLPAEIKRREESGRIKVLQELRNIAQGHGFSLEELVELKTQKVRKSPGTVAVKYRHPQNPELQWTGRGRTPRWVQEWEANGGSLNDLAV